MNILENLKRKISPIHLLVAGYMFVTLLGTLLLTFPVASESGRRQPFVDALFMASTGISTCGLVVVDIGSYYTLFGELVMMTIFQIGGLGYMAFFVFFVWLLKERISPKHRLVAIESISGAGFVNFFKFFKYVMLFTFIFEFAGAVILSFYWMKTFPFLRAVYLGIFHSISAFCTAGMSLFPDSLISYRQNLPVSSVITLLSLAGGIGFFVLYDIGSYIKKIALRKYPRFLSSHTKLALLTTAAVLLTATLIVFVSEHGSYKSIYEKLMVSLFQVISASTTDGFNTIDIGAMTFTSLFALIALMYIGASPGSTGGGIKTTSLGIIVLSTLAYTRGKDEIDFQKRSIPLNTVLKSFVIFFWFALIVLIDMLVLGMTEKGTFLQILFEIVSALGNTGLSTGITFGLTSIGKIFLIITMFVGRVGPLAMGLFLFQESKEGKCRYAEADILVG